MTELFIASHFSRFPRSSKKQRTVDAYSQKEEISKPIKPFERNVKKGWGKKNTPKIHYTEAVFDFTDVDDNIRLSQESLKHNRFENNIDTPWTQQKERKKKIKKEYKKKGRRTKKDVYDDLSQNHEKVNSDHAIKDVLVSAKEQKIENKDKTQSFYGTKMKKEIKTENPKKEVKERLKLDTRSKDKKRIIILKTLKPKKHQKNLKWKKTIQLQTVLKINPLPKTLKKRQ